MGIPIEIINSYTVIAAIKFLLKCYILDLNIHEYQAMTDFFLYVGIPIGLISSNKNSYQWSDIFPIGTPNFLSDFYVYNKNSYWEITMKQNFPTGLSILDSYIYL